MSKKNAQYYAERAAQLHLVRVAMKVSQALGVDRAKKVLFPAVAAALNLVWDGSRRHGYALVAAYAEQHQIVPEHGKLRSPRAVASDDFLRTGEWRRLRMVVIAKRGARCECCGASPRDGKTVINIDHIKPRKLFPELVLDESNLQVLCDACNHGKGNWDQTDWREPEPEGQVH